MILNGQTVVFGLRLDVDSKKAAAIGYGSPAEVLAALVADYDLWGEDLDDVEGNQVPPDYMCAWYTISVTVGGIVQCEVPGAMFWRLAHEHGFVGAENEPVLHEAQSTASITCAWAMLERGETPAAT